MGDAPHRLDTHCTKPHVVEYRPSKLELAWTEYAAGAAGHICELMRTPDQIAGATLWLNYSRALWAAASPNVALRPPTAEESSVLSQFVYSDGSVEFIEPLTGIARSPFAPVGCHKGDEHLRYKRNATKLARYYEIYDIRYIVARGTCGGVAGVREGCYNKARLYDLGCTVYNGDAVRQGQGTSKLGIGSSIPLFSDFYRRRCLPFDAVYGWDASTALKARPAEWYKKVPSELQSRIHYFNVPITDRPMINFTRAGARGAGSAADQPAYQPAEPAWRKHAKIGDFFATLFTSASRNDFVVVKLDIEGQTGSPEVAIAEAIASNPEIVRLVDEFYFEYHFWFDGMNFGWGHFTDQQKGPTVDTALRLMSRLRRAGVRAHFWV